MPIKDRDDHAEYTRLRAIINRKAYLKDKKCAKCKSVRNLVIARKNAKKAAGRQPWQKRKKDWPRLEKNVVILCRACYWEKRYGNRKRTHGTTSTYRFGCRCALCTLAHSDRMWAYKLKVKQRKEKA